MKSPMWRFCSVALLAGLSLFVRATPAGAAEERGGQMDRLERLEQRVNEMAERQEQFLRRFGEQMQRQGPVAQPGGVVPRRPLLRPGAPAAGPPAPHAARVAKGLHDVIGLLFVIGIICNILLAIWIFTDIRKRGEGSGIFVAMALVAGIPAALIYALTRIGEKKA
jgi:hypothetical protein